MAFTSTTGNSAAAWRPDLYTFAPEDVLGEALILQTSNVAGSIEGDAPSIRVAYVNDDDADFVAEGAAIDEAEPTLAEALVHTAKIAQLVRISREQYGQAGTAERLAASVSRALTRKLDQAYLTQVAPTSPAVAPVAGLTNVAGIVAGDPVAGDLDSLVDLIAELQSNGATPSHIVLDPIGWASARKLKTASGSNQSLVGAGVEDALPRLMGLPVLVNGQMASGTGLVLDSTAIVSAASQVTIATSVDQYFTSDSVAVRATVRTGHVVPRPDRIGKFTIADESGS